MRAKTCSADNLAPRQTYLTVESTERVTVFHLGYHPVPGTFSTSRLQHMSTDLFFKRANVNKLSHLSAQDARSCEDNNLCLIKKFVCDTSYKVRELQVKGVTDC